MVRYEYRCPACGPWTVALPMGAADARRTCPTCGGPSPRRWSALLNRMDPATARERLREEASRDVPEVVASVPPAARRRVPSDHRQARLPRP